MTIYVHNAGKHNATRVPVDRHKPGYWTSFFAEERRQALASSAQFVSDEEWRELAEGINAAIKAYHPFNKPYFFAPCCWPCCCVYSCQYPGWVNGDIAKLPVVHRLASRGIGVSWINGTKFEPGGVVLHVAANAPVLQVIQR